jgi:hypothetical protein
MTPAKFKVGETLYYVNPFVYIIDKVLIEFLEDPDEHGYRYYVDHSGAYLQEENLFWNLDAAQNYALESLKKFYDKKYKEILKANPQLEIEEND